MDFLSAGPDALNEINKAVIAGGDCLLLLRRRYTCSYEARLHTAQELLASGQPERVAQVLESYVGALQIKLRPSQDFFAVSEHDAALAWTRARSALLAGFQQLERERLGVSLSSWDEYARKRSASSGFSGARAVRLIAQGKPLRWALLAADPGARPCSLRSCSRPRTSTTSTSRSSATRARCCRDHDSTSRAGPDSRLRS